ncbi:MAG: M56 family metallopeptidase [Pseudohongiella sp.]|nr:M56 family metallopeptidase [Pseudohongiella sp.]MDP2128210.1 M56 family metallopeptidase [Pseudohongiella sp.]
MENVSWVSISTHWLAALIHQFPVMQQIADLAIKSIVLLAAFVVIEIIVRKKLTDTSRHLLWLSGLLCLGLLPFIPAVFVLWALILPTGGGNISPSVLFELSVYSSQLKEVGSTNWGMLFVVLYLLPVMLLLGRLFFALRSMARLREHSIPVTDVGLISELAQLRQQLGISRTVGLRVSNRIESPVSFGLFNPQILLPEQAREWNESIVTDVLLHELCHIKRLDWLTTLFAYVLVCVFWINPLVWLAFKRLREESENSCDTAVLHAGRSDTDYAESLLGVATSCIRARRHSSKRTNRDSNPLMQTMLDQSTLKTRISRVLEENKMNANDMKKETKKTAALLFIISVGVLGALGSTRVLLAQQQSDPETRPAPATRPMNDVEILPVNTIEPRYPTKAAEAGIEGWVHVIFTVSADGSVPENSIGIVDAEPADIFNNSALAAARQFRFSPRIRNGQPVDVPNVQYVFRYQLSSQESESAVQQ